MLVIHACVYKAKGKLLGFDVLYMRTWLRSRTWLAPIDWPGGLIRFKGLLEYFS